MFTLPERGRMIKALVGENQFTIHGALDKLQHSFIAEHGDLALERLDGEEASYEHLLGAIESLPLLSARKLVIIKNGSLNKEFNEQISEVLKRVGEGTDLVIVETKLDKRTQYFKQLKKLEDFVACEPIDAWTAPDWMITYVKEQGGILTNADARFLVERVGLNQQLLASELNKLLSYNLTINRQIIELLSEPTPQGTVFQLIDTLFAGNSTRALMLYEEQRKQRVEPQAIVGMLAWQLHLIAIAKTAAHMSAQQIAKDAKASPFAIEKSMRIANKLSLAQLKQLVRDIAELDYRIKTTNIDADVSLRQSIIDIANMI
jgi:DNA polymerase-3 subunit delta